MGRQQLEQTDLEALSPHLSGGRELSAALAAAGRIWRGHATAEYCPTFSRGDVRYFADLLEKAATAISRGDHISGEGR